MSPSPTLLGVAVDDPETQTERSRDVDRVLTYLDAIVAIAVTLLVLPLVDSTRELDRYRSVGSLLRHDASSIEAFAISFVIITRYWLAQHRIMRHVTVERRSVVIVLMAWAMVIVFMPFPTALIAENGEDPVVKTLYMGTTICGTLLLGLLSSIVQRHPEITDGDDATDPADSIATAVVFLVALALMLVWPDAGYSPLLLLVLTDQLADGWRALRGRPRQHRSLLRRLR